MIKWPFRVNAAIAGLGFPLILFTSDFRLEIQFREKRHILHHKKLRW